MIYRYILQIIIIYLWRRPIARYWPPLRPSGSWQYFFQAAKLNIGNFAWAVVVQHSEDGFLKAQLTMVTSQSNTLFWKMAHETKLIYIDLPITQWWFFVLNRRMVYASKSWLARPVELFSHASQHVRKSNLPSGTKATNAMVEFSITPHRLFVKAEITWKNLWVLPGIYATVVACWSFQCWKHIF